MISTIFNEIEPYSSSDEIEEIVVIMRLDRYNRNLPCGAKVIHQEMKTFALKPLPSLSRISNILRRQGLTHRRTGHY